MDEAIADASVNIAILRGTCSSPAEVRVLPSEQVLAQLQVTTRVDGKARSVPVAVWDPPAWIEELDAGDEIVVVGAVHRASSVHQARLRRGSRSRRRAWPGRATGAACRRCVAGSTGCSRSSVPNTPTPECGGRVGTVIGRATDEEVEDGRGVDSRPDEAAAIHPDKRSDSSRKLVVNGDRRGDPDPGRGNAQSGRDQVRRRFGRWDAAGR